MKYFSNKDIAKLFREIAAAYEAKGENRFKVIAYDNAATSAEQATSELKDLWEQGKLATIPGLGKSMQKYLEELFKSGKVNHFESIKRTLPPGMFALLGIEGLGPKSAYKLAKELKVKNENDLKKAAQAGKIRKLAGFGEKSEQEIITAISELKTKVTDRYLLTEASPIAERILKHLRAHKDCSRAEPLGSLRRMVATVGDIDIAVASKNPEAIIKHFRKFKEISRILDAGARKASALLLNGMRIDLLVCSPSAYGALLQHFTGSKYHNVRLREYALSKKMSVSDYGVKLKGKLNEFEDEEEFYKFLDMDFIEPELREASGEIEAALSHKLPNLVKIDDIRGDIHLHSNYPIEPSHDLGKNSFESIIKKAKELNYEYVGLSDHSPGFTTHTKSEIIALISKRKKKIEQLNSSSKNIKVLNLLEIDILTNGELSVPEEGLKLLNGSIAGIHSNHKHNKYLITKRLMTAINSPYVQVISHPTGRLLNQRESYEADWPKIFEACAKTGTLLEINAFPNRLDLPDTLVKDAIKHGVKFIINTDAHDLVHMDNMKYGVSVARRGWAEKKKIANTQSWVEFKKIFNV